MSATRTIPIVTLVTRSPFADLFVAHPDIRAAIAASMREVGFDPSKPIDLWDGVVIDGHTRRLAALDVGITEVVVYDHEFPDEAAAILYAIGTQRNRRNLGPVDMVRCVERYDAANRKPHGGDRRSDGIKVSPDTLIPNGRSRDAIADRLGVSTATVDRLRAIAKDDQARANLDRTGNILAAAKIASSNKRERDAAAIPTAAVVPRRPIEAALARAAIPGVFTVAEWAALDRATKDLLLMEAPLQGSTHGFNRTNDNVDWAHWTWNPVTGCLHDCEYCYARDIANRLYKQRFVPAFIPARLHAPRNSKVPQRVTEDYREANAFTCSMADLFGKWVPQEWIDAVFAEAVRAKDWRFLFLTKFPRKLAEQEWPENAWVGTSVDKQFRVEIAEKSFRDVRAGVKWLSCEPMLERLTFTSLEMFDWVVIGGESPNTQNPAGFDPPWEWIDHLYRQALDAGCRVYFKENLRNRPKELPAVLD